MPSLGGLFPHKRNSFTQLPSALSRVPITKFHLESTPPAPSHATFPPASVKVLPARGLRVQLPFMPPHLQFAEPRAPGQGTPSIRSAEELPFPPWAPLSAASLGQQFTRYFEVGEYRGLGRKIQSDLDLQTKVTRIIAVTTVFLFFNYFFLV